MIEFYVRFITKFRIAVGIMVLFLGVWVVRIGMPWFYALGLFCGGIAILIGFGRLFGAAVSRTGDEIVCRYAPWLEGNAFIAIVLVPLIGITGPELAKLTANARRASTMHWGGIMMVCGGALALYGVLRLRRRCALRITPATLVFDLNTGEPSRLEITREQVRSIKSSYLFPEKFKLVVSTQTDIVYRGSDGQPRLVRIGPKPGLGVDGLQLSVPNADVIHALQVWIDGGGESPAVLLDRVERILCEHQ